MTAFLMAGGDLDISAGKLQFASEAQEIRQKVETRLRLFQGEWSLDRDAGMPYFQRLFVKNPDMAVVKSIFREAVTETPGVKALDTIELDFDGVTRTLSVTLRITSVSGEVIDFNQRLLVGDL